MPRPLAFLFIQGWMGHQNVKAAQKLAEGGFTSMAYDMRGHGESEGDLAEFSRADFVQDALAAYDFLREQVGEGVKIGVVGSSFGSYTAVLLAEKRAVHCLSLRVPASYPDDGFEKPHLPVAGSDALHNWRKKPLRYTQNRAFGALHDFTGPVQIIEAGADEQVDRQAIQNYVDAVADKERLSYALMEGAPHSLVSEELQSEYEDLLIGWAQSLKI